MAAKSAVEDLTVSFNVKAGYVLLFSLIASAMLSLVAATDVSCWRKCDEGEVCCNGECIPGSICRQGPHKCTSHSDCSRDEDEACCDDICRRSYDCIGYSCSKNFDCATIRDARGVLILVNSCCGFDRKCRENCLGDPCSNDTACGYKQSCCYGTCMEKDCHSSTAVVTLGSIFGLLVLLCSIYVCIYLVRRHRRVARYGRLVTSQGSTLTSTIRFTGQRNPPPYHGENPSSYPYYPPPQYEQHQTIIASPYFPELTKASEAPPPYSVEPERRSGGDFCS